MAFQKAQRKKSKLRMALTGSSGSGKTYSAITLALGLVKDGERIAVIDTENGSASLYEHLGEYYTEEIAAPYTIGKYLKAIREAEQNGFSVLIIDSLTHAWAGAGGLLEKQGRIADGGGKNGYTAWREVTPEHQALIDAILSSKMHIIATMRSKTEYALVENEKGRVIPQKIGMAPVQRDGMEYEFTCCVDIDTKHNAKTSKDRTGLLDGYFEKIDRQLGVKLLDWLESGKPAPPNPIEVLEGQIKEKIEEMPEELKGVARLQLQKRKGDKDRLSELYTRICLRVDEKACQEEEEEEEDKLDPKKVSPSDMLALIATTSTEEDLENIQEAMFAMKEDGLNVDENIYKALESKKDQILGEKDRS